MSKNQSAVLIAEDNAEIAKLIKLYLEGEGYKTVWAEDGAAKSRRGQATDAAARCRRGAGNRRGCLAVRNN